MKKFLSVMLALTLVLALCACGGEPANTPAGTTAAMDETTVPETTAHVHVFSEATCLEAGVCACGETSGEPAGHLFDDATCTSPMTCAVCNITEGDALGHTYSEATCLEAATCMNCGETSGDLGDHVYAEGSCINCGDIDPDYFYEDSYEE